jgi:hypothetical protein
LETLQEKVIPTAQVTLFSGVLVDHTGDYLLPNFDLRNFEAIRILDQKGNVLAEGAPGKVLISTQKQLVFEVREVSGGKILEVDKQT